MAARDYGQYCGIARAFELVGERWALLIVRDLLVGQDPAKIEHWWSEMVRGTFWSTGQVIMSAVAGIDLLSPTQ